MRPLPKNAMRYEMVVHDLQTAKVLWVADGNGKEALNEFL
jgi:dipeptidase